MKLVYFLLKTFRTTIILAMAVGVVAGASGAGLIALINVRLNGGQLPGVSLAFAYAGVVLLVLVTNLASQLLLVKLAQGTSFDLRERLSQQMLAAPLRRLEELGSHRLLAILTEDIPALSAALLQLPTLCVSGTTLVVSILYLAWLSKNMLAAILLFVAVGVSVRQLIASRGLRAMKRARDESGPLLSSYRALSDGAKELKLHDRRRRAFLDDVLLASARRVRGHVYTSLSYYAAAETWSRLLYYIFLGLILFAVPFFQSVSPQAMTGYTLIVLYVMGPLGNILNAIPAFSRARVALAKIDELKGTLAAAGTDRVGDEEPAPDSGRCLELKDVTHTYRGEGDEGSFKLGPLSLELRAGELVYLVGGNGGGKTTLAKVVTGLYTPESGEVRLDGELVTDERRGVYRQHFSAVFTDFYLFERLLGIVTPDLDERVAHYLDKLRLAHKVKVSDGALSTTELSYGQRKRLALLTAYLEDRPFYVFDEWAAGQDPVFKSLFYTQLLPELKARGKGVLVISHDEKYYPLADRRLKLNDGRLEPDDDFDAAYQSPAATVLLEAAGGAA